MIKVTKTILYTHIPKAFLEDKELSITAKGLLATLYHTGDIECLKEEKETLRPFMRELVNKGYAEIKDNDIIIRLSKKTRQIKEKDFSIEKPKKKTLYEELLEMIQDFSEEEQKYLIRYFELRMNPRKDTRFNRPIYKFEMQNMIEELKEMSGNKVQIVKNSIQHQYFKFIDIKTKDNIKVSTSEKLDTEKRKKILESEGYLSEF